MVDDMKASIKIIKNMEQELNHFQMVNIMTVNGKMILEKVKGNFIMGMVSIIKANGKMI